MNQCSRHTCFVPDTGCDLGYVDWVKCAAWTGRAEQDTSEVEPVDEVLLPWSGSAMGLADLGFVAGGGRPLVVGVVGPQNAGKTTLLGAWYLLLGRGAVVLEDRQFAGSYSLEGWEATAGSFRWNPGQPPSFPPHTTSRSGRAPGLLHLSFSGAGLKRSTDYLLTDAPGEWFQKWAVNRDSAEGAGAHWIADHADVLLLIADREALSGENMGSARGALQLLTRRVAAERRGRPVALVWTKSDIEVPPLMEQSVREAVLDVMPDAVELSVSVASSSTDESKVGNGFIELLKWILNTRRPHIKLPAAAVTHNDPLFRYGGRSS
jgi:hypothetical protein